MKYPANSANLSLPDLPFRPVFASKEPYRCVIKKTEVCLSSLFVSMVGNAVDNPVVPDHNPCSFIRRGCCLLVRTLSPQVCEHPKTAETALYAHGITGYKHMNMR
jgi:hypothetical protein